LLEPFCAAVRDRVPPDWDVLVEPEPVLVELVLVEPVLA